MATLERISAGPFFSEWTERYCRHPVGRWAGRPVVQEDWQQEFWNDALEVDPATGLRLNREVWLGIPRKNSKSTMAGEASLFFAGPDGEASPQVILGAPSRENTAEVFDVARAFVDLSPELQQDYLAERFVIYSKPNRGVIRRAAADGKTQHGKNPHAVILDEVHGLETPRQVEAFRAWTTADAAREQPFTMGISTAGRDLDSLLGQIFTKAMALGDVEERRPGLMVCRDRAAGFLMYWFSAPAGCDLDDEDAWMVANPASWVTAEVLRRKLASPSMDEATFRRLYLNQWVAAESIWLPWWRELRSDVEIPDGADIYVGVDVGLVHDSTAVVWAHRVEDGRVVVRSKVFAAKENAAAHEYHQGVVDLERVEEFIVDLGERFRISELVYDPRFFERSAQTLGDRGMFVAPLNQNSAPMADAYHAFFQATKEGVVTHDGDAVLASHVGATAAQLTDRGWRVSKVRQNARIDACVASVMAVSRAMLAAGGSPGVVDLWAD